MCVGAGGCVEWSPVQLPGTEPLQFCVFNGSPITQKSTALNIDAVGGQRVQAHATTAIPDIGVCHVVFVPARESAQIGHIQTRYKGSGLLTISEETAERSGAVINMHVANNKMTIDVDLAAADARGIRVSSKLAGLARRVQGATTMPSRVTRS